MGFWSAGDLRTSCLLMSDWVVMHSAHASMDSGLLDAAQAAYQRLQEPPAASDTVTQRETLPDAQHPVRLAGDLIQSAKVSHVKVEVRMQKPGLDTALHGIKSMTARETPSAQCHAVERCRPTT